MVDALGSTGHSRLNPVTYRWMTLMIDTIQWLHGIPHFLSITVRFSYTLITFSTSRFQRMCIICNLKLRDMLPRYSVAFSRSHITLLYMLKKNVITVKSARHAWCDSVIISMWFLSLCLVDQHGLMRWITVHICLFQSPRLVRNPCLLRLHMGRSQHYWRNR